MTIEVNDNMYVAESKDKLIHYIVIKLGDKVYSTTFGQIPCTDITTAEHQVTTTKNIGKEDNFWIKGLFTETNGHTKMDKKLPFELNIYSEPKKMVEKNEKLNILDGSGLF